MANYIDYVKWRGDLSFKQSELNEIDITAFGMFSLIDFSGIIDEGGEKTIEQAFADYKKSGRKIEPLGLIIPSGVLDLFRELSKSARFKNLILKDYVNNVDSSKVGQFSAITIEGEDFRIISFSGTDDTIIGWRENFKMVLDHNVPAQTQSVVYLESVVKKDKVNYVTGHSKGGNLAMYSFIHASDKVQKYVKHVYSMDGPGMMYEAWEEKLTAKITEILPQDSIVGRLFNHYGKEKVVLSTNTGVNQHDAMSWQIVGTHYVSAKASKASMITKETIDDILSSFSVEQKELFVRSLDDWFHTVSANTLTELNTQRTGFLKGFFTLSNETKLFLFNTLRKLVAVKEVRETFLSGMRENQKMVAKEWKNTKDNTEE